MKLLFRHLKFVIIVFYIHMFDIPKRFAVAVFSHTSKFKNKQK